MYHTSKENVYLDADQCVLVSVPKIVFLKKMTIKTYPVFVQSNCGRVNFTHMTWTFIMIPMYCSFFSLPNNGNNK